MVLGKYSQVELVSMLKVWVDIASAGGPGIERVARKRILALIATQSIGTKYVMHNIGVKRRRWLTEFLNEKGVAK